MSYNKSKYLSKLLRHNPEDLIMNKSGFVEVESILNKLKISKSELNDIVETNDKKRFEYNSDETLIRAKQGHNKALDIEIDSIRQISVLDLKEMNIDKLYHGTGSELCETIMQQGFKSMSRQYVHLSRDIDTAKTVANRRYKDTHIFTIDAIRLAEDNNLFLSSNNVFLANDFSSEYVDIDFSLYEPIEINNSLHIYEEAYDIHGIRYRLLYPISDKNAKPIIERLN